MPTAVAANDQDVHELQCMEVWGGASKADHAASVPGLDVYVRSTPFADEGIENEVGGGDVYYISRCGSGRVTRIALADVAGHGVKVNDLAESLKKSMRRSVNIANQTRFARALNRSFDELGRGEHFATAILSTYYAPTDHLVFVNAGHPPPLLRTKSTGRWAPLDQHTPGVLTDSTPAIGIRNLPLGVIDSTDYQQLAIKLNPGDCVLMYTDAYSESINPSGQMIGPGGFLDMVQEIDSTRVGGFEPNVLIDEVDQTIRTYRNAPSQDDETMVLLHHNGTNPEKLSVGEKLAVVGRMLGLGSLSTSPA